MAKAKRMKKRTDVLVYEKNLAPSREKAKMLILEGSVFVNGVLGKIRLLDSLM